MIGSETGRRWAILAGTGRLNEFPRACRRSGSGSGRLRLRFL